MASTTTFNLDGYPVGVMLAIGATKEEMVAAASDLGCSTENCLKRWNWSPSGQAGHTATLPCHRIIMWFPHDHPALRTIAHESFHAIYGVLPQLGIRLSNATEEVFAYAIDSLVGQVSDHLNKADQVVTAP